MKTHRSLEHRRLTACSNTMRQNNIHTRQWVAVLLATCFGAATSVAGKPPMPRALRKALEARLALHTARLEAWQQRCTEENKPIFYTIELAGEDTIYTNWGDDTGVVGNAPERDGRPHIVLKTPSDTWSHDSDNIFAMHSGVGTDAAEGVLSVRSLGFSFFTPYDDEPDAFLRRVGAVVSEYQERVDEGGLHVVTAKTNQGQATWWIDPARGWSPVRIALTRDGVVVREARIELQQYEGRYWFPQTVEYDTVDPGGRRLPTERVEILYAEFNHPEHPQQFTPADIGIEPGFIIEEYHAQPGSELLMWDGNKPITATKFALRQAAGELRRGPANGRAVSALPDNPPEPIANEGDSQQQPPRDNTPSRQADASPGPSRDAARKCPIVERMLTNWQAYTRDFIIRNRLSADRARRAWRVLRACEDLAWKYARPRLRRINAADRNIRRSGNTNDNPDQRVKAEQRKLDHLLAPLHRIFENQLKPGLKKLLPPSRSRSGKP